MKKLLLASVAVSGLAFAAPAHADIDLEVGGYFKGYGAFVDQDETAGTDVNGVDFLKDTEIHLSGSTTLDNGLTVGFHTEFDVDDADASAVIDESYLYFSGDWGRVNFGEEDGSAYLLQVAAPSADSNIDGLRQFIQPFNATGLGATRLDYDNVQASSKATKLTYLSPIFSGFQAGLTFAPEPGAASDLAGVGSEGAAGAASDLQEIYEVAVRYEGQFQNVGVIAGAGYSHAEQNSTNANADDNQVWNVALDLDIGPFGIGAVYTEDNNGDSTATNEDQETLVIGADYTTGPFKLGISYLNQDTDNATEYDRYTAGVNYEYGPGMSFRGSIQHVEADSTGSDQDGTALLLGTQVKF